jgi:hypothetical protein
MPSFFDILRTTNPFTMNRVVPASMLQEDAEAVHQGQFATLLQLAHKAHAEQAGLGVVVWGEAGIGKSHLLARLGQWAGHDHKQAVFVYLANLQAEPEQLPRSLLRCVISILTRGRMHHFHLTPLYRMMNAVVRHALDDDGSQERSWQEAYAAYSHLIDEISDRTTAQAGLVDRAIYTVLFRFFQAAYVARESPDDGLAGLCVRWLAGDALDGDDARTIRLAPGPGEEVAALADDEQIKRVLIALAQLAWYRNEPLVLCFDQVDNLAPEQCTALGRFLHALLDGAGNLLVVTAGVKATLVQWQTNGVVQQSSWDRLALYIIDLQRVNVAEARQIVQARLRPAQALEPTAELAGKDPLFPLGENWAREFLNGKIEVRPRDVIHWAREGWRRQQEALQQLGEQAWLHTWDQLQAGDSTREGERGREELTEEQLHQCIDEKVAAKVNEHIQLRQQQPESLPADPNHLAGLIHVVLQGCSNVSADFALTAVERLLTPKYSQRPPYDLVLHHRQAEAGMHRSGLLCLVVSSRTSMTGFLRRLAQDPQPPLRLFLVTDERCPLDPGAAGLNYLEKVRQRHGEHFHHVELTLAEYVELDALQAVAGQAKSGDLEIDLPGGEARRLSEQDVMASHLRQQRYLGHRLLRLLLLPVEPVLQSNGAVVA